MHLENIKTSTLKPSPRATIASEKRQPGKRVRNDRESASSYLDLDTGKVFPLDVQVTM